MNKWIKSLFIILGIFILIIAIFKVPVKRAEKQDLKVIKQEKLSFDDKKLICKYSQSTGSPWLVVGKNDSLFNPIEYYEYIIIKGDFPNKFLNWDLIMYPADNKFIIEGEFIGEKNENGEIYKVFYVKKWYMLYPIDHGHGPGRIIPHDVMTLYDFLPINK